MKQRLYLSAVLALVLALGVVSAPGQTTNYWTNSVSGGAWSTAGNWDPNSVPAANNAWVLFTNDAASAYTVDLSGGNAVSGPFRLTSDRVLFDLQGNTWSASGVGGNAHAIGAVAGATATVTFASSTGSGVANLNAPDPSSLNIGAAGGYTVINIYTNTRVQGSHTVTVYNPSWSTTNVVVNIDGPGAEWRTGISENHTYNGIWNVANGGTWRTDYNMQFNPYMAATFSNATLRTGVDSGAYAANFYSGGQIRLYTNSVWQAKAIQLGWDFGGTPSVLVDNSAIYANTLQVGPPSFVNPKAPASLTIQNGGAVVLSNGYLMVNTPPTGATNLLVLNNGTIVLGGATGVDGALTNRSLMRASGTIRGAGAGRAQVVNEKMLEIGSSLGTLVLSNANLTLAAGSETAFEFSDTGLDQILAQDGTVSLLGSNWFSLASGAATPTPGVKYGLGTYDFIIASNITYGAQYDSLTNSLLSGLQFGVDYRYGVVDLAGGLQALRLEFVPEPSTLLLLVGGGWLLWRVRRRN